MATRDTLAPRLASTTGAKALYDLAREAFDPPADHGYAMEILSSAAFTGEAGAKGVLDDISGSAMFTNDFVCCAFGYKALNDAAKAEEMLGQGLDFAMSAEEKVAVGVGQMLVLRDTSAAVKTLGAALRETSASEELYRLAKVVTDEIKDVSLANQVFAKIKGKASRAADLARLAKAVAGDLGDKAQAVAILQEGAAKYTAPADLITLAGTMTEIDPAAAHTLYDKALASAGDLPALMQILSAVGDRPEFTRAVLTKAGTVASTSADLIQLADLCAGLGDAAGVADMLTRAEAAVTNLDDLRRVVDAVNRHLAADATRVERLTTKLARREANQAKYVEIQNEEAHCKTAKQFIALADRVMADLDDSAYAAKLLATAEEMLRVDGFSFSRFKPLILGVDRLGDKDWLGRLLDESLATASDFVWFHEIVMTAARELKDAEFGRARARAMCDARAAQSGDSPYEWTKLAELVQTALGDAVGTSNLLAEAAKRARDHFALSLVGRLYAALGDESTARAMYAKAVESCTSAEACVQLARRMKEYGLSRAEIGEYMLGCAARLPSAHDRLAWAEGVADLLLDTGWTQRAYASIAASFGDPLGKRRFERSRQMRLGYRFFGVGVQAH